MNRSRLATVVLAALVSATVFATSALSETTSTAMAPGDEQNVTCPTELSVVPQSANGVLIRCQPLPSTPAPTASPSGTPVPTPSPTVAPTATPTPVPTATATPTPIASPTPSASPPAGGVVGYGAGTVGGNSQPVQNVTTLAALRTALNSCPCNIQLPASQQVWNLGGSALAVKANTTLDGGAIIFRDGGIQVTGSQVILRDIRGRAGDAQGNGGDLDAVSVNAKTGRLDHIVWDRVEALWGPDVSATILGAVSDMTIQNSIIGAGLFRSTHPESNDADGHSLALNITQLSNNVDAPSRITIYESIIYNSQGRMPQFADGGPFDFVDNVVFGHAEGPQGNPARGLNIVGNHFASVPGRVLSWTNVFRGRVHSGGGGPQSLCSACVHASGNTSNYSLAGPTGSMGRATPLVPLSVASTANARTRVLAEAGALPRDSRTNAILADVSAGTATYFNGSAGPAPTPSWP